MTVTRLALGLLAVQLTMIISAASGRVHQATADTTGIACEVMESHTDSTSGVTAVIFHQQNPNDRNSLAGFLHAHEGNNVEFQTADGVRHSARMFHLSSCFGRGVLLFPSSGARLSEQDEITLEP